MFGVQPVHSRSLRGWVQPGQPPRGRGAVRRAMRALQVTFGHAFGCGCYLGVQPYQVSQVFIDS